MGKNNDLNKGGFSVAQNKIEAYNTQQKVDIMNQFNRNQPGNPEKLAEIVINTVKEENPPLHLIMGPDAHERITEYYRSQLADIEKRK